MLFNNWLITDQGHALYLLEDEANVKVFFGKIDLENLPLETIVKLLIDNAIIKNNNILVPLNLFNNTAKWLKKEPLKLRKEFDKLGILKYNPSLKKYYIYNIYIPESSTTNFVCFDKEKLDDFLKENNELPFKYPPVKFTKSIFKTIFDYLFKKDNSTEAYLLKSYFIKTGPNFVKDPRKNFLAVKSADDIFLCNLKEENSVTLPVDETKTFLSDFIGGWNAKKNIK